MLCTPLKLEVALRSTDNYGAKAADFIFLTAAQVVCVLIAVNSPS